ncbi:MAG: segregation/condensation protein A [Bdellovibrionaceae bacterium]|nr:segregation/condensation protein A [Pseudobdellovibrionaceae bacterium]
MSLTVQLPQFEGPLALLLYLIRKEEMDIMDINIHQITAQYLEYIKVMKELDLDMAGEFIAMAATLIQIKSKMLLPRYDENGEVLEEEDPRKELVQRLIEYQKYQEAAKLLYERPLVGRDLWLRGVRETLEPKPEEIELEENALFNLIASYRALIRSAKKKVPQVAGKMKSIAPRILEIKERLVVGTRLAMSDLYAQAENKAREALITFLSMLELGRLGFVGLYQSEPYSEIWVETKKSIETDIISRVEEFENVEAQSVAAAEEVETLQDEELQLTLKPSENDEDLAYAEVATDEEIEAAERELTQEGTDV